MRLCFGTVVVSLLVSQVAEGSFLRDVVGTQKTKTAIEEELLEKAIPLDEYRAKLRARGIDIIPDTRNLEQNAYANYAQQYYATDDYYMDESTMYSMSGYSLKYAACQPVQKFSEDAVYAGEYTPMITDDIVILRLCPSSSCSSSRSFGCFYNYAEYAVAISDYVRIMLRHEMDKKQQLCNWCTTCSARRDLNEGDAAEGQNNEENVNQDNQNDAGQQDVDQNQGGAEQEENNQEANNQDQEVNNEQGDVDQAEAANAGDDSVADDGVANDTYSDQAVGDDGNNANDANNANTIAYDDDGRYGEGDSCYGYKSNCYENGVSVCAVNNDDGSSYLGTEDYLNYMGCTNVNGYFLRPRCNGYDQTISMGIFYDQFCSQYAGDKVNMNSLGLGISPNAFQGFYSKGTCVDCSESTSAPYFNANANLCNRMHRSAARCTTSLQYDLFDSDTSSETIPCSFIESLRFGTYDEEGRLYTEEFGSSVHREMTPAQKWGLSLSLLICVYLAIYSCYLHHSITNLLVRSLSHTELLPHRTRQRKARSRSSRRQVESESEDEWKEVKKTPKRGNSSRR